jgi:hypothetical protein
MPNSPPKSAAVAATWLEFESKVLKTFGDMPKEARALAKASFYFGHIAMLGMVESVVEQAKSNEAIVRVLEGFREEIDETMERSAVRPN